MRPRPDDRVLVVGSVRGRGPTSGLPFELELTNVITVKQGQIVEVRAFATKGEALRAIGLGRA